MLGRVSAGLPIVVVVAADPAGWYPFGPAKWAVVTIAAALLVVGLARRRQLRLPVVATALWLVVLVAAVAAAANGVDRWYAWFGSPERHLGALTWLLLAVCFVAGAQLRTGELHLVARGGALAAVWVGAYTAVERWWSRPIAVATASERLGGPFGSAAYLGAACCLLVPIAAGVAVDRRSPLGWRVVGAFGAASGALALVGSGARAAWLGTVVAVVVAVVAVGRRHRRSVVWVAVSLVAFGAVAIGPRLDAVLDRDHGSASRLDEWRVATQVIADHPLLGVGPEGYRIAFGGAVDADYERTYGRDVLPDRAHSAPLDVAATLGVPAAAAHLAVIAMAVVGCVRWIARGRFVGVATGVVAYFTAQLLLFPLAELDPVAWLLAGAVVAGQARRVASIHVAVPVRRGLGVAGVVLATVAFVAGITDVAADRLARRGAADLGTAEALADARHAASRRPDVLRHHLLVAASADALGTLAGTDEAIAATEAAARWSPADPVVRLRHAGYLSRRAEITGRGADLDAALAAWGRLVAGDPNCFECQLGLGRAAALAGDVVLAEVSWQRAATLTTDDPRPAALLAALERVAG